MRKMTLITALSLIVTLAGFIILGYYQKFGRESHEFFGVMEGYTDNSITIRGAYMISGISSFEAFKKTHKVAVLVDGKTKFIKEMVKITGPKDIYGFTAKPQVDLTSSEEDGSFDEVKEIGGSSAAAHFNFRVTSRKNIYNRDEIHADEIRYSIIQESLAK